MRLFILTMIFIVVACAGDTVTDSSIDQIEQMHPQTVADGTAPVSTSQPQLTVMPLETLDNNAEDVVPATPNAPTQVQRTSTAISEAPPGSMFPILIGVGDHLIGVDIEPGIYVFATLTQIPPVDSCYWEVGNVSLLRDKSIDVYAMLRQRSIQGGRGIASTPDSRWIDHADGAPPFQFIEAREGDIWFRIWAEDRNGNRVNDTESCKAHLILPSENQGEFRLKNGANVIDKRTPPGLYVSTFSGDFRESCYYGWIDHMGGIEMYDSQRNVSRVGSDVGYIWEDKGFALVPLDVLFVTVSGCENEPLFYATHTEVGEALAEIYFEFQDTIERMQAVPQSGTLN